MTGKPRPGTQPARLRDFLREHPGASCAVCGLAFATRRLRGAHERWKHPEWSASPDLRAERAQESRDLWTAVRPHSVLFLTWSNAKARGYGLPEMDVWTPLQEGPCVYCHGEATTWDHVIPIGRGGPHEAQNLVPSCEPCNRRKNRYGVATALNRAPLLCGWCWTPIYRTLSQIRRPREPRWFACSATHLLMLRGYQPLPFGHPNFPRRRHVELVGLIDKPEQLELMAS